MNRLYPGGDVSITYNVSATGSETWAAKMKTPSGKTCDLDVSVSAPSITVTMGADNWPDGSSGHGFIEVVKTDAGAETVAVYARVRVMGSITADTWATDYRA